MSSAVRISVSALSNEAEICRAVAAINRRNAKKSTGPKTAEGKARASRNSFQYGLAVPIEFLPELAKRRDQISAAIKPAGVLEGTTALAAALLLLECIRAIRHAALQTQSRSDDVSQSPVVSRSSIQTLRSTVRYENKARSAARPHGRLGFYGQTSHTGVFSPKRIRFLARVATHHLRYANPYIETLYALTCIAAWTLQ